MINILLVCKNELFLMSIQTILYKHNILIMGVCKDPSNAVKQFVKYNPDIVVVDANWFNYGFSSSSIIKSILNQDINAKVVFVTTFFEEKQIKLLKEAGAKGYFFKNKSSIEKIIDCIRNVYHGAICFTEEFH